MPPSPMLMVAPLAWLVTVSFASLVATISDPAPRFATLIDEIVPATSKVAPTAKASAINEPRAPATFTLAPAPTSSINREFTPP